MAALTIQLLLSAVLGGGSPAATQAPPQAPSARELASTYDQATCATVLADGTAGTDGWDRAAIGEDAAQRPADEDCPVSLSPPRTALADCNDPLASLWLGEMIGTCDMPRGSNLPRPSLLAARSHDERRAQRLLVEIEARDDGRAPVRPLTPDRDLTPAALASVPSRAPPAARPLALLSTSTPLRSLSHAPDPRPPRA
jgi:hypothetical protein